MTQHQARRDDAVFAEYGAAAVNITDAYLTNDIEFTERQAMMIVYPSVSTLLRANGQTDEIFCPATTFTPLPFRIDSFNIKAATASETGVVYYYHMIQEENKCFEICT